MTSPNKNFSKKADDVRRRENIANASASLAVHLKKHMATWMRDAKLRDFAADIYMFIHMDDKTELHQTLLPLLHDDDALQHTEVCRFLRSLVLDVVWDTQTKARVPITPGSQFAPIFASEFDLLHCCVHTQGAAVVVLGLLERGEEDAVAVKARAQLLPHLDAITTAAAQHSNNGASLVAKQLAK